MVGVASPGNTVMTAFMLQMPSGLARVRLNVVNSKNQSSAYGQQSRQDKPILDPKVYQTAWDKIDEALFVMGALASPASKPVQSANAAAVPPPSPTAETTVTATAGPEHLQPPVARTPAAASPAETPQRIGNSVRCETCRK